MFKISGILKREELRKFTRKDHTEGESRVLYIEPEGSIYPIKVNVSDMDLKVGKQGEKVTLEVELFPYHFAEGKRKRALLDFYIPAKK